LANTNLVEQTKNQRLSIQPEATIGTFAMSPTASNLVPAMDPTFNIDRGTRLNSRAATVDGYAGEMIGAPGSFGATVSFGMEFHETETEATALPYWAKTLLACGFEVTGTSLTPNFALVPSTKRVTNFTDTFSDSNPCALSMQIGLLNNGTDTALQLAGCTGKADFSFRTGEIIKANCTFHGKVQNSTVVTSITNGIATGSLDAGIGIPYVCKDMNFGFVDLTSSTAISLTAVQEVTLSSNINLAEVPDPSAAQGFSTSAPLWDESATLTMNFAYNSTTAINTWQRFLDGGRFSFNMTAQGANGRDLRFNFPKIQLSECAVQDQNGYRVLACTFKIVRDINQNDLFSIVYLGA
jgi:hypothetical protein